MNFENFGRLIDSFTGGETGFRFAEVGQMFDAASGNNNQNYNQNYHQNYNQNYTQSYNHNYNQNYTQSYSQNYAQNYNNAYNNNAMMQRPQYEYQLRTGPLPQPIGLHYFAVGARALNCNGGNQLAFSNVVHVCFLLENDIFEYGCPEFGKNYVRRRNVSKTSNFNWNTYADRSSSTYSTPGQLENAIIQSGKWTGNQYNFCFDGVSHSHNCHDFVQFCLRFCAGKCGISQKGINML